VALTADMSPNFSANSACSLTPMFKNTGIKWNSSKPGLEALGGKAENTEAGTGIVTFQLKK
jgi:hypothetical protein